MAAPTPLVALYGDDWESPLWHVAVRGARITPPLSTWTIRAQAREHARATAPTFEWTVTGGGIVLGASTIELPSTGATLELDTIQLVLLPADWVDKPPEWSGVLDVELNYGAGAIPAHRHTVVPGRPFRVVSDTAR